MPNLRLDLCYDGTRYRGWQRLSGVENTIQGKLEQTLSRILNEPIEISGSGRTDAGAHALGQVANFHCRSRMAPEQILLELETKSWFTAEDRTAFDEYYLLVEKAPDEETLERCQMYVVLPYETRALYNKLWTELGI